MSSKTGLYLVRPNEPAAQRGERGCMVAVGFRTGEIIPSSGLWCVRHDEHNLPEEVTLIQGEAFPRCAECRAPVLFDLEQPAPANWNPEHRIILHALPEMPIEEERKLRKAS